MRQFLADENINPKGLLKISGKNFRYLHSVLRLAIGDMVYVRTPDGTLNSMTVAKIMADKKEIVLQIAGPQQNAGDQGCTTTADSSDSHALPLQKAPDTEFWLIQFVAKSAKMEQIIRQATECGVSKIIPVAGEFCPSGNIASADKKSGDRWKKIITEARQQSGSPIDTQVLPCCTLEEAAKLWREHCNQFGTSVAVDTNVASAADTAATATVSAVLYEQTAGTKSIYELCKNAENVKAACVVCGAEGGISPKEIQYLQEQLFTPIHFATNILRCETAAVYGIASIQTVLLENETWQFKE